MMELQNKDETHGEGSCRNTIGAQCVCFEPIIIVSKETQYKRVTNAAENLAEHD